MLLTVHNQKQIEKYGASSGIAAKEIQFRKKCKKIESNGAEKRCKKRRLPISD